MANSTAVDENSKKTGEIVDRRLNYGMYNLSYQKHRVVFTLLSDFVSGCVLIKDRCFRLMAVQENRANNETRAQSELER